MAPLVTSLQPAKRGHRGKHHQLPSEGDCTGEKQCLVVKAEEGKKCSWSSCLPFTSALRTARRPFNFLENKPAPKCSPGMRAERAMQDC